MRLFKNYIIESSIEIKTDPDKIWDFFYNLENNYKNWYPEEHHYFRWIKGKPLTEGSKFDSLEIVGGHKTRLKGVCVETVKNKKIIFKPAWPASIMCTRLEWVFESNKETTIFMAKTHYKFGKIFLRFKRDTANEIMEITKKHMDREGLNLKKLIE